MITKMIQIKGIIKTNPNHPEYLVFIKHVFKGLLPIIALYSENPLTIPPIIKHVIIYKINLVLGFNMKK